MRWLTFTLLAAFAICFQTTMARKLGLFGVYPDFLVILLVHYVLHARTSDCLIAAWLLGLLVDLASVERLGVVAVVYGLVAVAIWLIRDLMFARHPLTHFSVTLVFCFLSQLVLRGYFQVYYDSGLSAYHSVGMSLLTALYTALWAVIVHRVLLRFSKTLGLRGARRGGLAHAHG